MYYEGTIAEIYEDESVYWDYDGASNGSSKDPLSKLSPIKITEEWLMKLGFKKGDMDCLWINHYCFDLNVMALCRDVPAGCNAMHNAELKYVHQLQNLYFALTGEELQLK